MKKVKLHRVEDFPESTADGVVGTATFDPDDLPDDLKLPSKAWLAKYWRKWKAYERIWNDAFKAYEADDRDAAYFILKKVADPADLMLFLIEHYTVSTNTSKAGGEAKAAILAPYRTRARQMFTEKKAEFQNVGKGYTQAQFARWYRNYLKPPYEAATLTVKEIREQIDHLDDELRQVGLTALDIQQRREEKRKLQHDLRLTVPVMPSEKTIREWLSGL
jgi:hypothetical protein